MWLDSPTKQQKGRILLLYTLGNLAQFHHASVFSWHASKLLSQFLCDPLRPIYLSLTAQTSRVRTDSNKEIKLLIIDDRSRCKLVLLDIIFAHKSYSVLGMVEVIFIGRFFYLFLSKHCTRGISWFHLMSLLSNLLRHFRQKPCSEPFVPTESSTESCSHCRGILKRNIGPVWIHGLELVWASWSSTNPKVAK